MSEQSISDAIADVRMALAKGDKRHDLIAEIAAAYGLRPSVLASRIERAYGSIEELDRRDQKSATMRAIEARMMKAIYDYADFEADYGVNIAEWLAGRAGREPTHSEIQLADELWMKRALSKLMADKSD